MPIGEADPWLYSGPEPSSVMSKSRSFSSMPSSASCTAIAAFVSLSSDEPSLPNDVVLPGRGRAAGTVDGGGILGVGAEARVAAVAGAKDGAGAGAGARAGVERRSTNVISRSSSDSVRSYP